MSFPTTPVVDNFDAYAAGAVANWPAGFGDAAMQADGSGHFGPSQTNGWEGSYDSALGSLSGDIEMYVTITALVSNSGNVLSFHWRSSNAGTSVAPSANWQGYGLDLTNNAGTWQYKLYKYDGTTVTTIIAATNLPAAVSAGDSYGISHVGTTITIWRKPSAGAWASVNTATDSTYTAGWCGFEAFTGAGFANFFTLDNFGGGNVVTGGVLPSLSLLGVGA